MCCSSEVASAMNITVDVRTHVQEQQTECTQHDDVKHFILYTFSVRINAIKESGSGPRRIIIIIIIIIIMHCNVCVLCTSLSVWTALIIIHEPCDNNY